MRWLVVQLVAPIASFGELAGTVLRGGADRPGKGALLGLAGAALGVRREDAKGQDALRTGYGVATRAWSSGRVFQDYHTFESVPRSKERFMTRADALASGQAVTSITAREYRAGVVFDAAYRAQEGARWTLEQLESAFLRPRFTLFLGRKACPLAAPLDPKIVEADHPISAFSAIDAWRKKARDGWREDFFSLRERSRARPGAVAMEQEDAEALRRNDVRNERRHDLPIDRKRWHFAERVEAVTPFETDSEPSKMEDGA